MELTKKDVIQMIGLIKANYPYTYKDMPDSSLDLLLETWYSSLSKYDKRVVETAFKKAIEKCKMPPTLADIIENIQEITETTELSDTELWQILLKATEDTSDCTYYFNFYLVEDNGKTQSENAVERFNNIWESLPQILKDYCGSKDGLIDLSETDMSFEKGRFLRTLPTLKQRQQVKLTTNPDILKLVSELSKNMDSGLISFDDTKK